MQSLLFRLWDADGDRDTSDHHDYIGATSLTMGELMGVDGGVPGRADRRILDDSGKARGQLKIYAEEKVHSSEYLVFSLAGRKLANKDGLFGKSDPYFVVNRLSEDGAWVGVHKSEVIKNNLNPRWSTQKLSLGKVGGDRYRPLRIEVWDYDKNGKHDYMGHCELSVHDILDRGERNDQSFDIAVVEEKKAQKKRNYTNSGHLCVTEARLVVIPSFLDYLAGGLEISMMVSIDFTGSNGNPLDPISLHAISSSGAANEYERAINAVGRVLEPYDADKMFPVYGFGARTSAGAPVSHAFRLVPSAEQEEVRGVDGILSVYKAAIPNVQFSGPTIFTPMIHEATQIAEEYRVLEEAGHPLEYLVLLIMTDGVINDMQNTIDAIVECSHLPMSIIIVGVGDADFSNMHVLDGDEHRLRNRSGKEAVRDIVQFVPFRALASLFQEADLARAVLAELPGQVEQYFRAKHVQPRPRVYTMGSSFGGRAGAAGVPSAPGPEEEPPLPGDETPKAGPAAPPSYFSATGGTS
mmetsp:Transcript_15009/g.56934  ORF Transcript_15009/g.56934 Transcript_15009/m.56934 type:complete len:523 (+) Transcript_15009:482-2050(+)